MQVLKQEWPHKWQSFVPDLVGASKTSETLCENSMIILKLLSEEVFDFSKGELTQVRPVKIYTLSPFCIPAKLSEFTAKKIHAFSSGHIFHRRLGWPSRMARLVADGAPSPHAT